MVILTSAVLGEPFPIIHTEGKAKAISYDELPLKLPEVEKYQPTGDGEPPLANATEWIHTIDPETGYKAIRETNTCRNGQVHVGII